MIRALKPTAVALAVLWSSLLLAGKPPKISDAELAEITARGRLLFEYDQAAWHATDAVMATNPRKEDLGRYIAKKTDSGWIVAFGHLNQTRDAFLIAYQATQGPKPEEFSVERVDPPQRDGDFFLAAAKGIETALKNFQAVDHPYNVAVLPASAGQLYIYLVLAQTQAGAFPFGADARFLISPDGGTVIEKRQLHKSVIPSSESAASQSVAAGFHTHVLTDKPEDTDVLWVLTRKPSRPEYVGVAGGAVYVVETDGTIHAVKR